MLKFLRYFMGLVWVQSMLLCADTEQEDSIWTPVTALQQALDTNPEIRIAREQLRKQTGSYMQVRAQMLPKVELVGSGNTRDRSLLDRAPQSGPIPPTSQTSISEKSYNVGLEFRQLVFDGLSSFNQTKQHKRLEKASYWNLMDASSRVFAAVQQAYDAILMGQAIVAVDRQAVKTFDELTQVSKKRYEAGDVRSLDALRAQTELKRAEAQLANSKGELARHEENFKQLLQIPQKGNYSANVEVEGDLQPRHFLMPVGDAIELARKKQPGLIAAELEAQAARAQYKSSYGDYLPKVDAFARYNVQTSYYSFDTILEGWVMGVQGRWNIFDFFGREGNIKSQKAHYRQTQARLDERRYKIESEIREYYAQMKALFASIQSQQESVFFGKQAVVEGEKLYRAGEVPIEEVLDAQISLRRAQVDLQREMFNYNRLVYQLEYAVGTPLFDPDQVVGKSSFL